MRCCNRLISALLLILSLSFQTKAQGAADQQFDLMVHEIMMDFLQRDAWQKPDTLLNIMAIEPVESIAEIGAGRGYFTLKLAKQVGPDGKILALDGNSVNLNKLKLLKRYDKIEQMEVGALNLDNLKLEAASFDKIVMLGTYHGIAGYEDLLKQCREALKPGGKIIIIDRCPAKMDNDKADRKKLFKKKGIRLDMVSSDLTAAGFSLEASREKYTVEDKKINWFVVVGAKN